MNKEDKDKWEAVKIMADIWVRHKKPRVLKTPDGMKVLSIQDIVFRDILKARTEKEKKEALKMYRIMLADIEDREKEAKKKKAKRIKKIKSFFGLKK